MKLKAYVGSLAVLALAAVAFLPEPRLAATAGPAVLGLMGALALVAECCQVRYRFRSNTNGFTLLEGMLAPLIFASGGRSSLIVTGCAILVSDALRRLPVMKTVFNTAQWMLAVAVADLVFRSMRGASLHSGQSVVALLVAVVVMSVVNQLMFSVVLVLALGRTFGLPEDPRAPLVAAATYAVTEAINLVAALCLCAVYLWQPTGVIVGVAFVLAAYATGRANSSLRADRVRLEGMQRATHVLSTSSDVTQGLSGFLAEVRLGFEVQTVELVLFSEHGTVVHSCGGADGYTTRTGRHPLAQAVASHLHEPALLASGSGTPTGDLIAEGGHLSALTAPLRMGGTTTGVLFLYDRTGMEGFEDGELTIADALSREVVGFLERVELLQAIDGERRKLADILGSTSDGIFSIDGDGTITSWNAGLAAMTGYPAEEIVGTRHFGLLRPRDSAGRDVLLERWLDNYDSTHALPGDLQVVAAGGQSVWLSCSYSRVPASADERSDILVVVARNVTQARELERLKDDFVAVVSHELRTPLVPIKGWAQTLLNRGDRLSEDQRRTAVQSILAQAQKLESLVLNILEASRIEAGRIDGDGVADVAAIAARLVDDMLASRPDRVMRLRPPAAPCTVNGSPVWVERAVANLLANAVKYSPDDEPVDVVVSTDASSVVVAVTDRGPGIAADAQERIFERFERLEETRTQTGTGLGLYITRRLARAMGGDVTVSSVPGAGSTFLLRLPLAPVSSGAGAGARLPEPRPAVDASDGTVVRLR